MDLDSVSISEESSIRDTLRFLDNRRSQFALVMRNSILLGVVTDGDIRRSLLHGMSLETSISEVMNSTPKTLSEDHELNRFELVSYMNQLKIRALPVVDAYKNVVDLFTLDDLLIGEKLDLPALIMAGGKGERLKPLTESIPKPLIRVGNQRLIERTINSFSSYNISQIYIAVHHEKEKFFDALGNGSKYGVNLSYLEETHPLGTAGAIALIPELQKLEDLLVSNADLIHNIDYRAMFNFHKTCDSDLTISSSTYQVKIPFGVINQQDNRLVSIDEKPINEYPILCGVNILGRKVLQMFSSEAPVDMVTIIQQAIENNLSVNVFKTDGHWVDVGDISTLRREQSYLED